MQKSKKPKKEYTLKDVTANDLDLMVKAASTPAKTFFCFGKSWHKLYQLNLIDEDTRVTLDGYSLIKQKLNDA